jgi:hypothetical protein
MNKRKIHFISGLIITTFIVIHLFNHFYSLYGADMHIKLMTSLRHFYRNSIVETILILAVFVQIISGSVFFIEKRKKAITRFDQLQIWTGLYLAVFFIIHLAAVFVGRTFLNLDTNFYFGVAGLNNFPTNLFFIPYYALAIISFFGHIAAIHSKKMKQDILGLTPSGQSKIILALGVCLTIVIFYGLTNHFQGVEIPSEYKLLIGK